MKRTNYDSPEIILISTDDKDVITTSRGDTPNVNAFDW